LINSIYIGSESVVKYLILSKKVDSNHRNLQGTSALYIAVYKGNKNLVSFLLDNGADTLIKGPNHSNILHVCAERGFENIAIEICQRDR
jgi:ankyrin repeat protein